MSDLSKWIGMYQVCDGTKELTSLCLLPRLSQESPPPIGLHACDEEVCIARCMVHVDADGTELDANELN